MTTDDDRLPPGGVKRVEKGIRRGGHGKISRVGDRFPGRYIRDVTTWEVAGEPADNWPIFYGPWREHQS